MRKQADDSRLLEYATRLAFTNLEFLKLKFTNWLTLWKQLEV